jgi:hypothetical protein
MVLGLCISFIDLSTRRKIEQAPEERKMTGLRGHEKECYKERTVKGLYDEGKKGERAGILIWYRTVCTYAGNNKMYNRC